VHPCTRDIRASCTSKSPLISKPQIKTWGSPRQSAVLTGTCLRDFLDSVWKTCTVRVGFALPDVCTRICPIFVPIRSRSLFQTRLYRLLPCNRTSCIHAVVSWSRLSARPVQLPLSLLPSLTCYMGFKTTMPIQKVSNTLMPSFEMRSKG
jgi:hypothetical protein